jgi:hypothetical protein
MGSYIAAANQDILDLKARNNISGVANGTVTGDSLAATVNISTGVIQSSTYAEGLSGWKIDGTGVAEFSDVMVRGDINAYSGTIGYWNISAPGVERNILLTSGESKRLFGTFLESENLGDSDTNDNATAYVGLFRSYREDSMLVTGVSRSNNIASVAAPGHGYVIGDRVIIEVPGDESFSSGIAPVQVIDSTYDSFSYSSVGLDFTKDLGEGIVGSVTMYDESIAGLYLQDYSKSLFDYGYFSNEGIAYTTAESYNVIHNPSFEYSVAGTSTYSLSGWAADSNITVGSVDLTQRNAYNQNGKTIYTASSEVGLSVSWSDSINNPGYLTGTVNYSLLENSIKRDRVFYLNLDIFVNPIISQNSADTIIVAGIAVDPDDSSYVLVTTESNHNLTTGNYIIQSFYQHSYEALNKRYIGPDRGSNYQTDKVWYISPTTFRIKNSNPSFKFETSYPTSPGNFTKVYFPIFDLGDINFNFGDGSLVKLQDLVADDIASQVQWDASRYLTLSDLDLSNNAVYSTTAQAIIGEDIPKLTNITKPDPNDSSKDFRSPVSIKIDSKKLYLNYRQQNFAGLSSKNPFSIVIPGWTRLATDTKDSSGSYILDNLSISTEKKFFYGDSGVANQSWFTGGGATIPNAPSLKGIADVIAIDVAQQQAVIKSLDTLEFKSPTYSGGLFRNSRVTSINTLENDQLVWSSEFDTEDRSSLLVSAGAKLLNSRLDSALTAELESYIVAVTSNTATSLQISSDLSYYNDTNDQNYLETYNASVALLSDEMSSSIALTAERITFTNTSQLNQHNSSHKGLSDHFDYNLLVETWGNFSVYGSTRLFSSVYVNGDLNIFGTANITNDAAIFDSSLLLYTAGVDPITGDPTSVQTGRWDSTLGNLVMDIGDLTLTEGVIRAKIIHATASIEPTSNDDTVATTAFVTTAVAAVSGLGTATVNDPLLYDEATTTLSISKGISYNTDTGAYVNIYIGTASPTSGQITNGDVWIQV